MNRKLYPCVIRNNLRRFKFCVGSYSLERRGATVIVNDIGGDVHGAGSDTSAVDKVTRSLNTAQYMLTKNAPSAGVRVTLIKVCLEIEKNGGEAFPLAASVEDTNAIMGAVKGKFSI